MPMPTLGGGYGGVPPEILERAASPILGNSRGVAPVSSNARGVIPEGGFPRGGTISYGSPADEARFGRTFQDRFAGQPGGPTLGGMFPPQAPGGRMGGGPPSGPILAPGMTPPRRTHADILAGYADQIANRPAGIPQGPPRPGPIGPPTPGPGGVGIGADNLPPPIPMPYNLPPTGVPNELPPSPTTGNTNPFPIGGGPGTGGGVNPHPGPVGPPQQPPLPTPIGVGNQRPPGPQGPPTTPPVPQRKYGGPPINPNNQLGQPQPPEADAFAAWMRSRGQ